MSFSELMPMDQKDYYIKKSFIIPLGLDTVLLIILTFLSYLNRSPLYERGFLLSASLIILFVCLESLQRKVSLSPEGLEIKKIGRKKFLNWSDITHLGCLTLRHRFYLLLTTKKGFHIISNAYGNFGQLVSDIISFLPADKIEIEEGVRLQANTPTRNISDLIAAWLAAAVLTGIIAFKLFAPP